ncbi:hypothetical protein [Pedobacter sp. KBW01]|nr:hypothetical protein [Pedobacter sp. KBW01]
MRKLRLEAGFLIFGGYEDSSFVALASKRETKNTYGKVTGFADES